MVAMRRYWLPTEANPEFFQKSFRRLVSFGWGISFSGLEASGIPVPKLDPHFNS